MNTNYNILPTEGFLRQDDNPGAVVNVDNSALQAYKLRRKTETRKEDEINSIKQEVTDIKKMLSLILEKIDK
jgi:DNA-binding transcriptional regulator YhcF (GntR family)